MPNTKKSGYTKRDLHDVSDNPELTKADFAKALPFSEVFPDLSATILAAEQNVSGRSNGM
jgi:hypothetical protein